MSEELVLAEQHPVSRRWAVLRDDGLSGWLYLTAPDAHRPVAECWLYNRVPAPEPAMSLRYRGAPAPASSACAGSAALIPAPDRDALQLRWSSDGQAAAVLLAGQVLGFVVAEQPQGYSRHLLRDGPWGQTFDQALWAARFAGQPAGEP